MIKYQKLPKNITELLPKAAFYLNSLPEVQFVYLFGGLAKGDPTPLSDLDLALYLNPGRIRATGNWRFLENSSIFSRLTRSTSSY